MSKKFVNEVNQEMKKIGYKRGGTINESEISGQDLYSMGSVDSAEEDARISKIIEEIEEDVKQNARISMQAFHSYGNGNHDYMSMSEE